LNPNCGILVDGNASWKIALSLSSYSTQCAMAPLNMIFRRCS